MEKPVTSEEKLLKLIRQKKPANAEQSGPIKGKSVSVKKNSQQKTLDILGFFNKFLIVVCLGVVGFLGFRYSSLLGPEKSVKPVSKEKNSAQIESKEMVWPQPKPFDYFESKISERNLFYNPWEKPQETNPLTQDNSGDFTSQLKVVGIVLDKDPKVIIEDLSTNQTLFLSKGDKINAAVVKDILEDKVILFHNNREVVLTP